MFQQLVLLMKNTIVGEYRWYLNRKIRNMKKSCPCHSSNEYLNVSLKIVNYRTSRVASCMDIDGGLKSQMIQYNEGKKDLIQCNQ